MRHLRVLNENYDVAVIGGGVSGICAAIASAREGARTVLLHARSVLGGNASSEIRVNISGASRNGTKKNAEETGILNELLLDNKAVNPHHNFSVWDRVLLKGVQQTPNLTLRLDLAVDTVEMEGDAITMVAGYQQTTETFYHITAKQFIDCTGNGSVAYMAGAAYTEENECYDDYQEPHAPKQRDKYHMGMSILFKAVDRGEPVPFTKPDWAYHFTEDQLRFRVHPSRNTMDPVLMEKLREENPAEYYRLITTNELDYGFWWMEIGGDHEEQIYDTEKLRDELMACVYGVWDHLKNGGDHGAENYDLEWVGMVPGVRESRRLIGDYLLTENDVLQNVVFDDAVAYGGWPVDNHTPRGLFDFDKMPAEVYEFKGLYTIPYRCFYSQNVSNLLMAGRCISTTKLGLASTRVMGTCAVGGQAAGTAAAIAVKNQCTPREVGQYHIRTLQQTLLKNDCFIPGYRNEDEKDKARRAIITASSENAGCEAAHVLNGYSRTIEDESNVWEAQTEQAQLTLRWETAQRAQQVRLTFDQDLNQALRICLSDRGQRKQPNGIPERLVRDYDVLLLKDGQIVHTIQVRDNHQRQNILNFEAVDADEVQIHILRTHGYPCARVYEVRVY